MGFVDGVAVIPGLPVIGNLLQLKEKKPHKTFAEWAETHGPIFSIRTGASTLIVLNSAEVAKEVRFISVLTSLFSTGAPLSYLEKGPRHVNMALKWCAKLSQKREIFKVESGGASVPVRPRLSWESRRRLFYFVNRLLLSGSLGRWP